MILDQFGSPIDNFDDDLQGSWRVVGGVGAALKLPSGLDLLTHLNRRETQKASVVAYYLNPLLYGAVEVIKAFVLGAGLSYGEFADKRAQACLEDFWFENDLEALAERYFTEHLLTGESLTVFPRAFKGDQPARVGLFDVVNGTMEISTPEGMPDRVDTIRINSSRTLQQGEYHWQANEALFNDPRGWPVVSRAVGPSLAYINFINSRIRVHEIASRINAIYYALADSDKALDDKAKRFRNMPRNGSVLTLGMTKDGQSEKFEFASRNVNAGDSSVDGKMIKQLVCIVLGLPDHYLAEGGGVTRTTADSMGAPARKGFERRQRVVSRWINGIFRMELMRRNGPERLYTVQSVRLTPAGDRVVSKRRVSARLMEVPLGFPELNDEDLQGLVAQVRAAAELRLASRQTLAAQMGYDYAAEVEYLAGEAPLPTPPQPQPDPPSSQ